MPLLDHFHPPLIGKRPWEGVHSEWAGAIARQLNRKPLPERFFAIPHIHFGGRVEIDVATVEYDTLQTSSEEAGGTATTVWAPPRPTLETEVDFVDLDVIEMRVYDEKEGLRLVAAVELVSPANKDREEHREAFAVKCAAYLQEGVSLMVVDVITERTASLHRQLLDLAEALRREQRARVPGPVRRRLPDVYGRPPGPAASMGSAPGSGERSADVAALDRPRPGGIGRPGE